MRFFKNKVQGLLQVLCTAILLVVMACTDNNITYGPSDEPIAPVGFRSGNPTIIEGESVPYEIEVGASKAVFNDISFDLQLVSGDDSEITITDADGNAGPNFTVPEGSATIKLFAKVADNSIYSGNRSLVYELKNLVGDGVFLADTTYSASNSELGISRRVSPELRITITEDDPVPPLVNFVELESEVLENAGSHEVVIALTEAVTTGQTLDITFTGTAVEGTNYDAGATGGVLTVNVGAGETEVIVPITLIDNAVIEGDKTIVMTIGSVSPGLYPGESLTHTVTVLEDDYITAELIPIADTHVKGLASGDSGFTDNFGAAVSFDPSYRETNSRDTRRGLLKFDLTGIDASKVVKAKLVLTTTREDKWVLAEDVVGGITTQYIHYISDDSWGESTVTGETAPEFGDIILTFTGDALVGPDNRSTHNYDLTSQLQMVEADNTLSLGMTVVETGGKRIFYQSKEGTDIPKLIISMLE
ncbi:CBM96 family carbohydrate-binding protein [Aestuariivivens insulae]|uniref:CBM96 family carbohydrate-binding protein n=1 Tax=Aestuariivivens insulae TaxID=1621988 RepID=UPI001F5880A0|nr:DNRLRE domain-containing protein [Aestuariivivens insulae]